jgi:hypothetical protein
VEGLCDYDDDNDDIILVSKVAGNILTNRIIISCLREIPYHGVSER